MSRRVVMLAFAVVLAACSSSSTGSPGEGGEADESGADTVGEVADDPADDEAAGSSDEPNDVTDADADADADDTDVDAGVTANLDWSVCDDAPSLECATVGVPLDHADAPGTAIDIALARQPALDPANRIGSLVFNPGGPGGSGIEFLELAAFSIPPDVAARFDLVSFDPRGVGASAAVECDLTLDDGVPLVAAGDRAAWDEMVATSLAELDTCTSDPAELADHVGTNQAARDLDLIRAALGDEQLSYVGFSYGTRLGATYAELFPERVRAMVLDGAVKPTTDLSLVAEGQSGGFDLAYENFAAACDADDDCILQELGPTLDVAAAVRSEVAELGSFPTDDPDRILTPGELDLGIISALYSKEAWPFLAQAFYLADTVGDGSLFQVLTDNYLGRQPDGTYTNQNEANGFINCADNDTRLDVDASWERSEALGASSTHFDQALRAGSGCLGFADPVDPLLLGPASGAAPILVIGTTGDPATPYEWSVEMADALESGVLYTVDGEGHTAYTSIECVSEPVGDYLIDLIVPDDGDGCVDDARDVFVPAGESEIDLIVAFFDCLIDEGVEIEPVTAASVLADPTGEQLFADIDLTDPEVGLAIGACQSLLEF